MIAAMERPETRQRETPKAVKSPQSSPSPESRPILEARDVSISYGQARGILNASISIPENRVTAVIGPSGCGKSTLLRAFNRMNDFIPNMKIDGRILYRGDDVYERGVDPVEVRRRIGMVFQKPNPFPKSIYQNVAWGPGIHGRRENVQALVESSLRKAALWDEVKDRLHKPALDLSGGQQQRLCIARAIAMEPEVILMDEPCSALDPSSTSRIEDLINELKARFTIIIVTHNMQQAARVSDFTAFFCEGKLIEFGPTPRIFTSPEQRQTEDYITGRFG